MLDLVMGMTEESLFSVNQTSLESQLVIAGLHRYRTADAPIDLADLIASTGANGEFVRERFPSDQAFASACLQWLAGEWEGFESFARQFRSAAMAGVEALLEWVGYVARGLPRAAGCRRVHPG